MTTNNTSDTALTAAGDSRPAHHPTFSGKSRRTVLGLGRSDLLPVGALIALIAYFSERSAAFATSENMFNILRQSSVLLIVGVGTTFIIMQGSIDLSMGSVVTLSGIWSALLLQDHNIGLLALPVAVAIGLLSGLLNGLIFAYLKVPSFLVTLGTLFALDGIATRLSNGQSILITDNSVTRLATGRLVGSIPNIALWAAAIYLLGVLLARYTKLGRYSYAIGGGERVSALAGVPVRRYKLYAFALAGSLAGLGGILLSARVQAGTPRMGESLLLDAIAAVVIGGTALTGGVGGPARTLVGVLIIGVLSNGLDVIAVDPQLQTVVKGVIVILAVLLTTDRAKIGIIK